MRTFRQSTSLILLVLFCTGILMAQAPELKESVYLMDGSQRLQPGWYTIPHAVDWNSDGNKDLLVGQVTEGYIYLFLNQGTDLNPVFNGSSKVESNGQPITMSFG